MSVTVRIPAGIRPLAGNRSEVTGEGTTLLALVEDLERRHPGVRSRLLDEKGRKRKFINIYVNSEDIRFLQNENTPLKEGDQVDIVAAIAGG